MKLWPHKRKAKQELQERRVHWKAKADRNRRQIADRIHSPEMLVASLAGYLEHVPQNKRVPEPLIIELRRNASDDWYWHMRAARRILKVNSHAKERSHVLSIQNGVGERLNEALQLNANELLRLNTELEIDPSIAAFVREHPDLIERAKRSLVGWKQSITARLNDGPVDVPPPAVPAKSPDPEPNYVPFWAMQ